MESYIYLVHPKQFVKSNQNIYKIGKTRRPDRICFYGKGSLCVLMMLVGDCDYEEKRLIKFFKQKFKLRNDIGLEYFEGNLLEMTNIIFETCNKMQNRKYRIKNKIINKQKVTKEAELKCNEILVKASKLDLDYNNLKNKKKCTSEESTFLDACEIMHSFNIKKLTIPFLENMNNKYNYINFRCTLLYFSSDAYIEQNLINWEYTNSASSDHWLEKIEQIKRLALLFFKDDIISKDIIKVPNSVDLMTPQQKQYLKPANIENVYNIFKSLKYKAIPQNAHGMIKLLNYMLCEVFGKYISIDQLVRCQKGTGKNKYREYTMKLNNNSYIELLLVKYYKNIHNQYLQYIKSNYKDSRCTYVDNHGYSKFEEIWNIK